MTVRTLSGEIVNKRNAYNFNLKNNLSGYELKTLFRLRYVYETRLTPVDHEKRYF